jgi:hypothetical protein
LDIDFRTSITFEMSLRKNMYSRWAHTLAAAPLCWRRVKSGTDAVAECLLSNSRLQRLSRLETRNEFGGTSDYSVHFVESPPRHSKNGEYAKKLGPKTSQFNLSGEREQKNGMCGRRGVLEDQHGLISARCAEAIGLSRKAQGWDTLILVP